MDESTGWGGEFWLHNGTALQELLRVTEVSFPEEARDEIEVTTLKAPNQYKEFISGMRDGGEFNITMNYIPGSATDQLARSAYDTADVRAWKIVVPGTDGTAERQFTGTGFAKSYKADPLSPNDAKKIVLTIRTSGAVSEEVAS